MSFSAQRWTTTVKNALAREERERQQREDDRRAAAKAAGRGKRQV